MPDIRRLVENIAEALGPHTPPERIEAVAAAVLDSLSDSTPVAPTPMAGPGERAIVTAYGVDKPGILASITNVVSGAGCNILDVSQKILQGYFTLIMLADIAAMQGSLQELQRKLDGVGHQLQVHVLVQHEDLFKAMHRP